MMVEMVSKSEFTKTPDTELVSMQKMWKKEFFSFFGAFNEQLKSLQQRQDEIAKHEVSINQKERELLEREYKIKKMFTADIRCFFTKKTYDEDIIGLGVILDRQGKCSDFSFVSYVYQSQTAFFDYGHTKLPQIQIQDEFTNWIPIYINKDHGSKMKDYLIAAFHSMIRGEKQVKVVSAPLDPAKVVTIISNLMDYMLLILSNQCEDKIKTLYIRNEKGLDGYCLFHRLLLFFYLDLQLPGFKEYVEKQIAKKFGKIIPANEVTFREMQLAGKFSELILILTLKEDYQYREDGCRMIKYALALCWINLRAPLQHKIKIVEENGNHVVWVEPGSEDEIMEQFFEATKPLLRAFMLNSYFLQSVARPQHFTVQDSAARYDSTYGRPTSTMKEDFEWNNRLIHEVKNLKEFFHNLGLTLRRNDIPCQSSLEQPDRVLSSPTISSENNTKEMIALREKQSAFDILKKAYWVAWENGYFNLNVSGC